MRTAVDYEIMFWRFHWLALLLVPWQDRSLQPRSGRLRHEGPLRSARQEGCFEGQICVQLHAASARNHPREIRGSKSARTVSKPLLNGSLSPEAIARGGLFPVMKK